jgi:hypothetical protein
MVTSAQSSLNQIKANVLTVIATTDAGLSEPAVAFRTGPEPTVTTTTQSTLNSGDLNTNSAADTQKLFDVKTTTTISGNVTETTKAVNVAGTEVINFRIVERTPPKPPAGQSQYQIGQQSIAPLARGIVTGTALQMANLNFSHVCDFRFVLNIGFSTLGLPDFISLIGQAIKNAKLRAAALIRTLVTRVVDAVRAVFNLLIKSLTFDPTGEISVYVSVGKDWLRKINYWAKKIAQFIEDVLVVVEVAKQILQLIQFILSLPDRIKALVRQCIANFLGSVTRLVNQITNLPNTVVNQYDRVVSQLTGQLNSVVTQLQSELDINNIQTGTVSTVGYVQQGVAIERDLSSNLSYQLTESTQSENFQGDINNVIISTYTANTIDQLSDAGNNSVLSIDTYVSVSTANATSSFSNTSNNMTVTVLEPYDKANTANTMP